MLNHRRIAGADIIELIRNITGNPLAAVAALQNIQATLFHLLHPADASSTEAANDTRAFEAVSASSSVVRISSVAARSVTPVVASAWAVEADGRSSQSVEAMIADIAGMIDGNKELLALLLSLLEDQHDAMMRFIEDLQQQAEADRAFQKLLDKLAVIKKLKAAQEAAAELSKLNRQELMTLPEIKALNSEDLKIVARALQMQNERRHILAEKSSILVA